MWYMVHSEVEPKHPVLSVWAIPSVKKLTDPLVRSTLRRKIGRNRLGDVRDHKRSKLIPIVFHRPSITMSAKAQYGDNTCTDVFCNEISVGTD